MKKGKEEARWKQGEDFGWMIFKNCSYELEEKKKEGEKGAVKKKVESKSLVKEIYISGKKADSKGATVYTPDGYGILQDTKLEDNKLQVKVSNKITAYNIKDLYFEIPILLKIVSQDSSQDLTISVPSSITSKELFEEIIEKGSSGKGMFNCNLYFEGKELKQVSNQIINLGIKPYSKILGVVTFGKVLTISRFGTLNPGWGYYNSVDGISFSVSKTIFVVGFGIYCPDRDGRNLAGVGKFLRGQDAKGAELTSKEFALDFGGVEPEKKVHQLMFDKPIKVQAGEIHSCVMEVANGGSFYGNNGKDRVTGEGDITFQFLACNGSFNGTGIQSGQIPEIYYYS